MFCVTEPKHIKVNYTVSEYICLRTRLKASISAVFKPLKAQGALLTANGAAFRKIGNAPQHRPLSSSNKNSSCHKGGRVSEGLWYWIR